MCVFLFVKHVVKGVLEVKREKEMGRPPFGMWSHFIFFRVKKKKTLFAAGEVLAVNVQVHRLDKDVKPA